MYGVAMARSEKAQPEHPTVGHVLHLRVADGVHRLCLLLMGRIYATRRAAAHLVDHAADLYPDHHLHLRLSEDVRGETRVLEKVHYPDMVLYADTPGGNARAYRLVGDAQHLLGSRYLQPERHLLGHLQLSVY